MYVLKFKNDLNSVNIYLKLKKRNHTLKNSKSKFQNQRPTSN